MGGTSSSYLPAISSENLAQPEPEIEPVSYNLDTH